MGASEVLVAKIAFFSNKDGILTINDLLLCLNLILGELELRQKFVKLGLQGFIHSRLPTPVYQGEKCIEPKARKKREKKTQRNAEINATIANQETMANDNQ